MSIKRRILLISIFTSFAFWIPIWLPFAAYRSVDTNTAYGFIALYSLLAVIFEYPTGVVGDTYSHKLSAFSGYLCVAAAMASFILLPGTLGIGAGIAVFALGTSLISGSDQAYFHNLLQDKYRSFYPVMKNTGMVATLVGVSTGTIIFSINPNLPLWLNLAALVVSALVLATLPSEKRSSQERAIISNPFITAKLGLKEFLQNRTLRSALIVFALLFSFSNNLKWLYGNLLEIVKFPVGVWGILIALFYFGRFMGIVLQKKLGGKKASIAALIAIANLVFILGYIYNPVFVPILIFLVMVLVGITETNLELDIQQEAPSHVRASILSLKSLLGRGAAAVYITFAGYLANSESVTKLTLTTFALLLFGIGIQVSSYLKQKESNELGFTVLPKSHSGAS